MEVWRIKHEVPFPLIPDPRAAVGKALDIPGTPTYVVLDRQGRGGFRARPGRLGSPQPTFCGRSWPAWSFDRRLNCS